MRPRYDSLNTSRLLSSFWSNMDLGALAQAGFNTRDAVFFFDDFFNAGAAISSNQFYWTGGTPPAKYEGFGTTGVTMAANQPAAGDDFGVLRLTVDADNENAVLSLYETYQASFGAVSDTAGDNFRMAFEARVRFSEVASTDGVQKAIGMAAGGLADGADEFLADADGDVAGSFIGFRALVADGDGMDAIYGTSGTNVVAEESANGAAAQTLTADTWGKFGWFYDGERLHFYVNGTRLATPSPTDSLQGILPADTSFPDATALYPIFGVRGEGTTPTHNADIDWWAVGAWKDVG